MSCTFSTVDIRCYRSIPSRTNSSTISSLSSRQSGESRALSSALPSLTPSVSVEPSSSSGSSLSSAPPVRRSTRHERSPSFSPSDLDTFLTARRSLPRSVRFPTLPSISPSIMSAPGVPIAPLSDPADQWRGEEGEQASIAFSRRSANSLVRRERALTESEVKQKKRLAQFMAEEQAMREQVEAKMKLEDEASEMGRPMGDGPRGSAVADEPGVIRRRLEDLEHEAASLRRVLGVKQNPSPSSPLAVPSTSSSPVLARFGVKVKVDKPKPWTGVFEEQAREMWIRCASLYLVGNELELDAILDEHLTPAPSYVLRFLFSSDATHGLISPQAWFDARNRRSPFSSVTDVFVAMRSHWADDHAAEDALARYRAVSQGTLRARDFGAKVCALADACTDRLVNDLDRKTTFLAGLNSSVRDFVKTQMASRTALGKTTATFEEVVKI
ncbi:hypothetical protein JCM11641_001994 [Rhodosporidiobolus odoratus]